MSENKIAESGFDKAVEQAAAEHDPAREALHEQAISMGGEETLMEKIHAAQKRAVRKSVLISAIIAAAALAAGIVALGPSALQATRYGRDISSLRESLARLEGELLDLKKQQAVLQAQAPADFEARFGEVRRTIQDMEMRLASVANQAQARAQVEEAAAKAQMQAVTIETLSRDFKTLSADIVAASLAGPDVPAQDRALSRLSDFFQIKKDGALITGTHTQALVDRGQQSLDLGNIQGAVAELQKLSGPALQKAQPWIDRAQGLMAAQAPIQGPPAPGQ